MTLLVKILEIRICVMEASVLKVPYLVVGRPEMGYRSNLWLCPEPSTLFQVKTTVWTLAEYSGDPAHWLAFRQMRNKLRSSDFEKNKQNCDL